MRDKHWRQFVDATSPETAEKVQHLMDRMWHGSGEPGFDGLGLKSIYDGSLWQHMYKPSVDVSLPEDTKSRFQALQPFKPKDPAHSDG